MKMLILTYYWPPAAGPGVQRALKLAKYFNVFGFEVHVLTVSNGTYPALDHDLVGDLPIEVKVHRFDTLELFGLYLKLRGRTSEGPNIIKNNEISNKKSLPNRIGLFLKKYLFFPDPRVGFYFRSKSAIDALMKKHDFNVIVSSSPPHSVQLVGLRLKRKFPKVQWVADFRDPWANLYHNEITGRGWILKKMDKIWETRVLKTADLVLTTSKGTAQSFKERARAVLPVYNGFDDDDFEGASPTRTTGSFVISYVGGMGSTQNPENFWEALSLLCAENETFSKKLKLRFAGTIHDSVVQSIKKHNLDPYFEHLGYVSHTKAVDLMRCANILLLVNPSTSRSNEIIPGKVFEYIATRHPVISFAQKGSDVQAILEDVGWSYNYDFQEVTNLKNDLCEIYSSRPQLDDSKIAEYSRKNQYLKIYRYLQDL